MTAPTPVFVVAFSQTWKPPAGRNQPHTRIQRLIIKQQSNPDSYQRPRHINTHPSTISKEKKTKDDSKNQRRICRHWDFESQFVLRIRVRNKCIKMTRCETVGRWLKFRKIHSTTSPNKYCSSKCKKKMLLCPLHAYAEYIEPTVIYRNLIALLTEKLTLAMATKNCFVHIRPWVTRMNL